MGKTARWFRGLLTKKDSTPSSSSKKKWTFVGSYRDRDKHPPPPLTTAEAPGKFTSSRRRSAAAAHGNEVAAAVRIQKMFRGYLARRALKALRGVVRLQALVRGHITRKKKAEEMRCMQALLRLQSKARASRIQISETQHPSNQQSGPATPEKHERTIRSKSTRQDRSSPLKRNSSVPNSREAFVWDKTQLRRDCLDRRIDEHAWDYYCRETKMKYGLVDDNKTRKILETDHNKPHLYAKHQNQLSAIFDRLVFLDSPSKDSTSVSSGEVQSRNNRRPKTMSADSESFCISENSPHFYSATSIPGSSKMGPFTPTTSDCSRSFHSVCTDHPNYMANTESSRAKARSQSAPKQRLEFEKSSSARRYNAAHGIHGSDDMRRKTLRASVLQSSYASKEYPGSGRLDRLGMPTQHEYGGTYDNRY